MKNLKLNLLCFFLFFTLGNAVNAQVSSIPFTAALDSFAPITGVIIDSPNADDQAYSNIPIGFNFDFAGSIHSSIIVSCNGYIQLDSFPTSNFVNILGGNYNNRIAALGADLKHSNPNASLQYTTVGTAPDRVCIIQWLHYSYFGSNIGDLNFQIRLHETSNCISFVYGANTYSTNNFQTQIGLRGTTSADFIVLGDTTCNWADAYPFPTITTTFPISTSCSMPPGFAFYFGACGYGPGVNFSYLTGTVFNDADGNGTKGSGELPIANHVVNINPGNYYVSSDGNGDYTFFFVDSTITYSLNTIPITWWNNTTPLSLSVSPLSQSCSGNNFGFRQIPGIHEVGIHCPSWGVRPAQPEPMPISYYNHGTSIESDTIVFIMDSLYSFISANPAPLSVNGQTITWVYPPIAPGQSGNIQLMLMPDSSGVLGNYMNSTLSIGPLSDTLPSNNTLFLHQLITLAWDPNDKIAMPSGRIQAGDDITYTIRFQNTGNATAYNVTIKDTLDQKHDLMSFEILGTSHPLNFNMSGNGIATFTFFNIQLPDSGSNYEGSNGFVTYRLKSQSNLQPMSIINNQAGIIFDWNPPVMTNITSDTIDFIQSIQDVEVMLNFVKANPNPSSGQVVFRFSENYNLKGVLQLFSTDGKLVYRHPAISSTEVIELSMLSAGVYIATIQTAEKIFKARIVIQK